MHDFMAAILLWYCFVCLMIVLKKRKRKKNTENTWQIVFQQ